MTNCNNISRKSSLYRVGGSDGVGYDLWGSSLISCAVVFYAEDVYPVS
jgi:hypothetical protein